MHQEISLKRQHTSINKTTQRQNSAYSSPHNHRRENLKFHIFILFLLLLGHPMSAIQPLSPSKICIILSPQTADLPVTSSLLSVP